MADEPKADLDRANFLLGIIEKAVKWPKLKAIHDHAMAELEVLAKESDKHNKEAAKAKAEADAKEAAEVARKEAARAAVERQAQLAREKAEGEARAKAMAEADKQEKALAATAPKEKANVA